MCKFRCIMKLNRLLFLSLASSLATVACSGSSAEESEDADQGALANAYGQACVDPGADSARTSDADVSFCSGLADAAAAKNEDWASVYGQCSSYATRFKSNISKEALSCIKAGQSKPELWSTIYDCGFSALSKSCLDSAKDASLGTKCKAILPSVNPMFNTTRSGDKNPDAILTECKSLLAGLEAKAVTEVENCVRKQKFPVSSCVEGLDSTLTGVCTDPGVHERVVGLKESCEQLLTVSSADEGVMNRDLCLGIGTRLRAHPANDFVAGINQLVAAATADKPIGNYAIQQLGGKVIRNVCHNAAVDDACAELVTKAKNSNMSNAGGRITRECHQLMSAVDDKGASQIRACNSFQRRLAAGADNGSPASPTPDKTISLFWCVSDLKAYPSEL